MMLHRLLFIFALFLSALSPAAATQVVPVGVYPFLPFVDKSGGLTADLVQAMNAFQKDYEFQLVKTSPNRRYRDMADGAFTVMFFENSQWGWDTAQVDASKVFLRGDGEVYVARASPGRDQTYFNTLQDKHMLGVLGYHYGFANFERDQAVLRQRFNITFGDDNSISLRNLLEGRGDVAVITKSYLKSYLLKNPNAEAQLIVSDRFDQTYSHMALIKKGSQPSAVAIDALLGKMAAAGVLKKLWARYGIEK